MVLSDLTAAVPGGGLIPDTAALPFWEPVSCRFETKGAKIDPKLMKWRTDKAAGTQTQAKRTTRPPRKSKKEPRKGDPKRNMF